jgi:hypothetical protein
MKLIKQLIRKNFIVLNKKIVKLKIRDNDKRGLATVTEIMAVICEVFPQFDPGDTFFSLLRDALIKDNGLSKKYCLITNNELHVYWKKKRKKSYDDK